MRKILLVIVLFVWMGTACTPAAATEPPSIIMQRPTPTPAPEEATLTPTLPPAGPAEEAAIERLAANLGLQEKDISVISSEVVEFKNSCLDMVIEDVPCTQVTTPGQMIVLEAQGVQYEYRTSRDGKRIVPATLALVWKREGGIAGFCDTLVVFLSGEVFANQCISQAEGKIGTFAELLSPEEQQEFNDWFSEIAEANLDVSDPKGVADGMAVTLEFYGTGSKAPTKAEQQTLFGFAQDLYQELTK